VGVAVGVTVTVEVTVVVEVTVIVGVTETVGVGVGVPITGVGSGPPPAQKGSGQIATNEAKVEWLTAPDCPLTLKFTNAPLPKVPGAYRTTIAFSQYARQVVVGPPVSSKNAVKSVFSIVRLTLGPI
jgi:hypothetical protein